MKEGKKLRPGENAEKLSQVKRELSRNAGGGSQMVLHSLNSAVKCGIFLSETLSVSSHVMPQRP